MFGKTANSVFLLLFVSLLSYGQEKPKTLFFRGYLKYMETGYIIPNSDFLTSGLVHNRLNFKWRPNAHFTSSLEVRNRFIYGEAIKLSPFYATALDNDPGLIDLSFVPFDGNGYVMSNQIDRLWMRYQWNKFELTVGRQRVNWGINLVWNPNDIFNTYSFVDFDYEERPGSDAVRLSYQTGSLSGIDVVIKPGKNKNDDVFAAMYKFNKKQYDVQVLGGYFNTDYVAGFGWAGNIKTVGFKGEVTGFVPGTESPDTAITLNAALGFDYILKGKVFLTASYLYSSRGKAPAIGGNLNLFIVPDAKNISVATHSGFLQANGSITPLIGGGMAGMYLFEWNQLFLMPSLSYSIKENWDIGLFGQYLADLNNGFDYAGMNVFLRLKWSF